MGEVKIRELATEIVMGAGGRKMRVEWDSGAGVTPLGPVVYFSQFLGTAGLFCAWIKDCPLEYQSNNAPEIRDVLGTTMLSILSGHRRYTHVTMLRQETVCTRSFGMGQICSEDSVRRAWKHAETKAVAEWQRRHLRASYAPALEHAWVADLDVTVKPVYGHQEGAEVGYNPRKPGRPSHAYHTVFMARLRLALDVEVLSGKAHAAGHGFQSWWQLWDELPPHCRPYLVRGDCAYGQENLLSECERRGQAYVFRLRMTRGVKQLVSALEKTGSWQSWREGWSVCQGQLRLQGWSQTRRVAVLRRWRTSSRKKEEPLALPWDGALPVAEEAEYQVLVTNTAWEAGSVAETYRQRADSENPYDELKNQWGWGGYVTRDLKRCQIAARNVALVYNWWTAFTRCAQPDQAREALTSRPMLLHAVGVLVQHADQLWLRLTSIHMGWLSRLSAFSMRFPCF
jgi:hypothetical protein